MLKESGSEVIRSFYLCISFFVSLIISIFVAC